MKRVGLSYDWSREVNTTDPDYYRWTQWIFLNCSSADRLRRRGAGQLVPCPRPTVLANEEIVDGKSEGGGFDVVRRPMRQWVLPKITAYADRLLDDPSSWWTGRPAPGRCEDTVDRPARSGPEVDFPLVRGSGPSAHPFTTSRHAVQGPPTMVLAPEHPLVDVCSYRESARADC